MDQDSKDKELEKKTPADSSSDQYRVDLPVFEGPLDLLLHLIRQHEIDIFDIPIAMITEKYLEYLEWMRVLNLDIAGDFLVMAATLAHIKSKMLLPPDETQDSQDDDEDEGDPREELVKRLLEYQRYKEAAKELKDRPILDRDVFGRGEARLPVMTEEEPEKSPFAEVSVFKLIEALNSVMQKAAKRIDHEVLIERISIADRVQELVDILRKKPEITFVELFMVHPDKTDIIITFIALLEMARLRMVRLHQVEDSETIYVRNMLEGVEVDEVLASANLEIG
jgi:segregation and condensation protein A